jgi:hypothetical protein
LRDDLQNTPDQRRQVRWPCSKAVEVHQVLPDYTLGGPQPAKCRDISFGGVAFWVAQRPTAKLAYLHFNTLPDLASFALLVRIVRIEPTTGGGFKVGAAFAGTAHEGIGAPQAGGLGRGTEK